MNEQSWLVQDHPEEREALVNEWVTAICNELEGSLPTADRLWDMERHQCARVLKTWLKDLALQNIYLAELGRIPTFDPDREGEERLMAQAAHRMQEEPSGPS